MGFNQLTVFYFDFAMIYNQFNIKTVTIPLRNIIETYNRLSMLCTYVFFVILNPLVYNIINAVSSCYNIEIPWTFFLTLNVK